jgi:hypothetical protein
MSWFDIGALFEGRRHEQPAEIFADGVEALVETYIETFPQIMAMHSAEKRLAVAETTRDFRQVVNAIKQDPSFILVDYEPATDFEYTIAYAAFLDDRGVAQAPRNTHTKDMKHFRVYLRGRLPPRHLAFTMDLGNRQVKGEIMASSRWRQEVPECFWGGEPES